MHDIQLPKVNGLSMLITFDAAEDVLATVVIDCHDDIEYLRGIDR